MKCVVIAVVMLTAAVSASAQSFTDSLDREAAGLIDIQGTPSVDPEEILDYLDLLYLEPHTTHRSIPVEESTVSHAPSLAIRSRAGLNLEAHDEVGYINGVYLGSPLTSYDRAYARLGPLAVALSQSKGRWEPHPFEHYAGFAEWSAPLELGREMTITSAILGNYSLAFANGLMFGGGITPSRTYDAALAARERSFGLRGSLSNSYRTLQGGALALAMGQVHVTGYYSNRSIDARLAGDTIATIETGASHTTASQESMRADASIGLAGTRIELVTSDSARTSGHVAATGALIRFDHEYAGPSAGPFVGRSIAEGSVDIMARASTWSLRAEAALERAATPSDLAVNATLLLEPVRDAAFSIEYYHLPSNFYSPFGSIAGGSNGLPIGRDGVYLGLQSAHVVKGLRISAYADLSTLPDLHFSSRDHTEDYFAAVNYALLPNQLTASIAIRDKHASSLGLASPLVFVYSTIETSQINTRYELEWRPTPRLESAVRYEHQYAVATADAGDALRLSVSLEGVRGSSLSVAFTRFSTESFDAAIYQYEPSLPGLGSIILLSGTGDRLSVRGKAALFGTLDLSLFLGETLYDEYRTIGSGPSARTGRADINVAAQLDLRI